jgi:hypothetical protein
VRERAKERIKKRTDMVEPDEAIASRACNVDVEYIIISL